MRYEKTAHELATACVISDFRRDLDENCALLGCYATSGNSLLTFRDIGTVRYRYSTVHEDPHYAVFFSLLLLAPSWAHLALSAPYNRTPPACILRLI